MTAFNPKLLPSAPDGQKTPFRRLSLRSLDERERVKKHLNSPKAEVRRQHKKFQKHIFISNDAVFRTSIDPPSTPILSPPAKAAKAAAPLSPPSFPTHVMRGRGRRAELLLRFFLPLYELRALPWVAAIATAAAAAGA